MSSTRDATRRGPGRRAPAREPFPLVLCAPSGTGKTTLARELVRRRSDLVFSVSATTRPARAGERDGVDYRFVSDVEFDRLRRTGALLEWARVHTWRYGTPAENLRRAQSAGKHLVLDIDVQGARKVREAVRSAVAVFLLPPGFDALLERLAARGAESERERAQRLRTALAELRAVPEFPYVIVNDRLEGALAALEAILDAERHRLARSHASVGRLAADLAAAVEAHLRAGGRSSTSSAVRSGLY